MKLIEEVKLFYKGDNQLEIDLMDDVFARDSSTVDLCLNIYWWATFRSTKEGIKIHLVLK